MVRGRDAFFLRFWRSTLYEPELKQQDGPGLLCRVNAENEFSLTLAVELNGKADYDAAGAMIFVDDHMWFTAGLEIVGGETRLSIVHTMQSSDWSASPWPAAAARIRIHKVAAASGSCAVVEAAP